MSGEQGLPRWDKEETCQLVHAQYGAGQLILLKPAQRAVSYRLAHAEYHYREYLRIAQAHIDSKLQTGSDIWEITSPTNDEEANSLAKFYIECEAHLYAFVQAVHAVPDNLAHVVYYVLGLNLGAGIKPRVSLDSIETHVGRMRQTNPMLNAVADLLTGLKKSGTFVDLNNLVNQLKHHGGPSVRMALQPSGEKAYEVQFDDFVRDGEPRAAVAVDQFLAESYRVLNVAVVDVGIALNTWLQSDLSQKAKSPDESTEAITPTRNPQST